MYGSNDEHDKPVLHLEKAPYGHADEPPLATVFPEGGTPPVVHMSDEQIQKNAEALHSFADEDTPVFPPVNVGIANADESQYLPRPQEKDDQAEGNGQKQEAQSLRSFVKARPLVSILVAAAFGALLVRVLAGREDSRAETT